MKSAVFGHLENFSLDTNLSLFPSDNNNTIIEEHIYNDQKIPIFINGFWTASQRQASSIHEISYRACFKPQLPKFFISLLTENDDIIYDPFLGRGTTAIETAIMQRNIIGNDINPLSKVLTYPRLNIPGFPEIIDRLKSIKYKKNLRADIDLSMFYHPETENEIVSLKNYLTERKNSKKEDNIDAFIRMVATNRLTGHSTGFFSVYTMPPNQAVLPESQIKINEKRKQKPEYRDTKKIILKKTKSLFRKINNELRERINYFGKNALLLAKDARNTKEIESDTVALTVTSPPFLNIVQYATDNWLRCWFSNIDIDKISSEISVLKNINDWESVMGDVFKELYRITRPDGWVAFEVGEVRKGSIKLDEIVVPLGIRAGFKCICIIINNQEFTKTSHCWGVKNNEGGTNTNRIVLFQK